jgi:nucleotide-binding universal stress UspA family protein
MDPTAIVSYDDTLNDHAALALGRVLRDAGADLILAYVRHATNAVPAREQLEERDADALLERGARWLGDLDVDRRVVVHASTGEGLKALARQAEADLIIFGSDYRTAHGHVAPQSSTDKLLDGGRTAIAIAPAGFTAGPEHEIRTIGLLAGLDDHAAIDTAHSLATRFDAEVTDRASGIDLLIVGSRPEAQEGQVLISSRAHHAIEAATAPVLVVARGVALNFRARLYVS